MMKKLCTLALMVTLMCGFTGCDEDAEQRNAEFDRLHETAQDYTAHEENCYCAQCYVVEAALEFRNTIEADETYGGGLYHVSVEKLDTPFSLSDGSECANCYEIIMHFDETAAYVPEVEEVWSIVKGYSDAEETTVALSPIVNAGYAVKVTNNSSTPMGNLYILH